MSWLDYLIGFERLKRRGDLFFLAGDFDRALGSYRRARRLVRGVDYRAASLEALIRECAARCGETSWAEASGDVSNGDRGLEAPFAPVIHDLFELALADKPANRAERYRDLGTSFESGYVALVQGDAARAVAELDAAAHRQAPSLPLQLELGRAFSLAGDMERARAELEKALSLEPDDAEAVSLLAAVEIQLGLYRTAEERLSRRISRDDADAPTHFLLGRALVEQGRSDEALEHFRRALELDPHFADACYEAARLSRSRGNIRGAFELLSRACDLVPEEVAYNREMVSLVLDEGLDVEPGLAACDRLMVTDEDNRWQYLGWIAELYVRRGWKREARDPLSKALSLVPAGRTAERRDLERRLAALDASESPDA